MVINQTLGFVFLIVISFVCHWPNGAWSQSHHENVVPFRGMGSKCWNGLGKCDDICDGETTRKIDYSCEELNTCCVPKKIVVPINSIGNQSEQAGGQLSCALNNGKCHVKCLPPTTVYQGSVNECPLRYFCCISNPSKSGSVQTRSALDSDKPSSEGTDQKASTTDPLTGSTHGNDEGSTTTAP